MTDTITKLQACKESIEVDCKPDNFPSPTTLGSCALSVSELAQLGDGCVALSSSPDTAPAGCDCWQKQDMTNALAAVESCNFLSELNALKLKRNQCVKTFVACKNERLRGQEAAKECSRNFRKIFLKNF